MGKNIITTVPYDTSKTFKENVDNAPWNKNPASYGNSGSPGMYSASGTNMASTFIDEWLNNLETSKDLFSRTDRDIDTYSESASSLSDEYDLLNERFGGLRDDALEASKADMENRNVLGGMYMDAISPDYEGASSRAIGDVATQAERGREMQTRSDLARGLNPGSSASKISKSKSFLDEAIGKVLASNSARNNEKMRVGGMAAQGMNLFDPNRMGNLALGIQDRGTNIKQAESNIYGNVASARNNLATSYTGSITTPAGESAGMLAGLEYAGGKKVNVGTTNPLAYENLGGVSIKPSATSRFS